MREEMSALRAAVDANINGMKRDFDMKSGALNMMGEKVINLEREIKDLKQENKDIKEKIQDENNHFIQMVTPRVYTLEEDTNDIKMKMEEIKNIVEIIKDDDKLIGMTNKNSETTKKTENMIIDIEAKLKQYFNSNIEDMHARVNDVINQIVEI